MKKLIILILFLNSSLLSFGQASTSLNKSFPISFKNASIESVLADFETKGGFRFSYSPEIFKNFSPVSYNTNSQPIKLSLMEILDDGISFKTRGNYVILQKKKSDEGRDFLLMGYISNEITNEKINNVSIYEPLSLASTISNQYGYYQIKLRRNLNDIALKVQKHDYFSETVKVPFRKDGKINIGLKEKIIDKQIKIKTNPIQSIAIKIDSVIIQKPDTLLVIKQTEAESKPEPQIKSEVYSKSKFGIAIKDKSEQFMDWLMSTTQKIHLNNIQDSISRPFQLSLLPFIGTNGRLSSTISNDVSINIISGVSRSIYKFEMGGILNLVRENMSGIQLSGFSNVVGKSQNGLQLAGFSNINFGESNGLVGASFGNFVIGPSSGVQMAGFGNLSIKNFDGVQMAGFGNINIKTIRGLQLAGFGNMAIDSLRGSQIAPFNFANKMKNGVQIGIFNFINKAENAIPIGFFSYVQTGGYRRLEIGTNELKNTEFTFKTGVKSLYNIFTLIYNPNKNSLPTYGFGYGIGTAQKISNRFGTDLNVTFSQFNNFQDNVYYLNNNLINISASLEFKITNRMAIYAAPTLNWYMTDDSDFDINKLKVKARKTSNYSWMNNFQSQYHWIGFKAGIRLCNIR